MSAEQEPVSPLMIGILYGEPTHDELAALVVVLSLRCRQIPPQPVASVRTWSAPSRRTRPALLPGPDGWRRSILQR